MAENEEVKLLFISETDDAVIAEVDISQRVFDLLGNEADEAGMSFEEHILDLLRASINE